MSTEHVLDDGIKSIKDAWQREHTASFNLERMLENIEAENAKLRDERDRMYKANVEKNGEILRLLEENAKLRELCFGLAKVVKNDDDTFRRLREIAKQELSYDFIGMYDSSLGKIDQIARFIDSMAELGIEVLE